MEYTYEEVTNESLAGTSITIKRIDKNGLVSWIPLDPANSDYQAYLDRDKPKAALSTPMVEK